MKNSLSCGVAFIVLSACGVDSGLTTRNKPPSPLERTFQLAAREYQVPVGMLKAVGYVETRLSSSPQLESHSGGVGLMQLATRGDIDTLGDAATLTGTSEATLRADPHANIRGAAAVLRKIFDATQTAEPSLDGRQVGDWYAAVSHYPGFDSATVATEYASEVFQALERGFEVEGAEGVVSQAPTVCDWRRHAPLSSTRKDALLEYPGGAAWLASPNFTPGRKSYEFIIIHTMQGSYSGTKAWFLRASSKVSSHYLVRSEDGQITQMVEHQDTAWHAQCYNGRSIGIEHEGYVQDPGLWYTDVMYRESAKLTRWVALRHSIPQTRTAIIGHADVAPECNTNRHTDPGSGWNWTKYMQYVTGLGATTGLIGVIYRDGDVTHRVEGAVVSVDNQTLTTGSNGLYQFTLSPGDYSLTVSKTGFTSASITRTVVDQVETWGSMEINPAALEGTLEGKVYQFNPDNPADTSMALEGVLVTTHGQGITTGADGLFHFTLPPGMYAVSAAKAGYEANQATFTVTEGNAAAGNISLAATTQPDVQAPQLAFVFPAQGAVLDLGRIEVKGTAVDDRGALSSVKISLNGEPEIEVTVANGSFFAQLLLSPGPNEISASAIDAAGNMGTTKITALFKAGVMGKVHLKGDAAVPIADATIELRVLASGTLVSSASTDASGAYFAPVSVVPADYMVRVKKPGYLTASETVSVPLDTQRTFDVELTPGEDMPQEATLSFVEPLEGTTLTSETATVYGTVQGFEVATVKVNDVQADLLGAGGFSAVVPLALGTNVIEATATGVNAQTASGRLTLNRVSPPKEGCGGCSTGFSFETLTLLTWFGLLFKRQPGARQMSL